MSFFISEFEFCGVFSKKKQGKIGASSKLKRALIFLFCIQVIFLTNILQARPKNKTLNNLFVTGNFVTNSLNVSNNILVNGSISVAGQIKSPGLVNVQGAVQEGRVARFANDYSGQDSDNCASALIKKSPVSIDDNGNVGINGITKNGVTTSWPSSIGASGTFLATDGFGALMYAIAQGVTGPVGSMGPTGNKGEVGDQGPTGNKGPIGDIGPTGNKGDIGDQGPTGNQGIAGPAGETGPTGPIGATGAAGNAAPAEYLVYTGSLAFPDTNYNLFPYSYNVVNVGNISISSAAISFSNRGYYALSYSLYAQSGISLDGIINILSGSVIINGNQYNGPGGSGLNISGTVADFNVILNVSRGKFLFFEVLQPAVLRVNVKSSIVGRGFSTIAIQRYA